MHTSTEQKFLLGGDSLWETHTFHPSTDQIRNGASTSFLQILPSTSSTPETAVFSGVLSLNRDLIPPSTIPLPPSTPSTTPTRPVTPPLFSNSPGGAGFAAQNTDVELDLSGYKGLRIDLVGGGKGKGKRFLLVLRDGNGKEEGERDGKGGVNWEGTFDSSGNEEGEAKNEAGGERSVFLPWKAFRPFYRGKEVLDGGELDVRSINRMGFMIRSFFGKQEGPFRLAIRSVVAI